MALEYFNDRSKAGGLLWLWNILKNPSEVVVILLWLLSILMTVSRKGYYCGSGIFL